MARGYRSLSQHLQRRTSLDPFLCLPIAKGGGGERKRRVMPGRGAARREQQPPAAGRIRGILRPGAPFRGSPPGPRLGGHRGAPQSGPGAGPTARPGRRALGSPRPQRETAGMEARSPRPPAQKGSGVRCGGIRLIGLSV